MEIAEDFSVWFLRAMGVPHAPILTSALSFFALEKGSKEGYEVEV